MTSHSQAMRTTLRQGLFFSFLFALAFQFVSCDSGGSNNPSWVGDWVAVSSTDDGYDEGEYWAISTEKIEIKEPIGSGGCTTEEFTITNRDGNTVVVTEESSGREGLFKFEGSGDIITVREDDEGGSITLESVSSFSECN